MDAIGEICGVIALVMVQKMDNDWQTGESWKANVYCNGNGSLAK
jgi:hypothetical protein